MEDLSKIREIIEKYHQFFYELLPDWFLYDYTDRVYIKQRIGFALYGPPDYGKHKGITNSYADLSTFAEYDKDLCKTIDKIYKRILECNKGNYIIQIGHIYNIVFDSQQPKSSTNSSVKGLVALPIFKLKVVIGCSTNVWYIDSSARVYKNWKDYLENNTLPKCMMVVPKDGTYQCNPHCTVTRWSSTVWIEMLPSHACGSVKTILKTVDISANVVSIGSAVGLGVASLLTPIGPILTGTALISCAVSGAWNIGRSVERLVDLSTHEESISPTNGDAFAAYFGIASSAFAIGANGGTMLLSKAAANGSRIGNVAKVAYTSLMIGNLTVSGFGIAYEGYRLIDQYKTQKEVDIFDIMLFSSQILFFSNSLMNMKLAGELIGTSRGTILEKFKSSLRSDRFEQEYAKTSGNKRSTRIVHKLKTISNKTNFLNTFSKVAKSSLFVNGMMILNGITLQDPFIVAHELLTNGMISLAMPEPSLLNQQIVRQLITLVMDLQRKFYQEEQPRSQTQSCDIKQLNGMFNEMSFMNNAVKILTMIVDVAVKVMKFNSNPASCMPDAIKFLWEYSKANLRETALKTCIPFKANSVLYDLLTKVVTNVFNFADELIGDLQLAFSSYMIDNTTKHCFS